MEQYISKAAVVAEIERLVDSHKSLKTLDPTYYEGLVDSLDDVLSFLDTIEVKEKDLENSMVCKVGWYDGFFLDYTQEQQNALLEKIGANVGDKIRVILIKE